MMKKNHRLIVIATSFLAILLIIGFSKLGNTEKTSDTPPLPTLNNLEKKLDSSLVDLGSYQIMATLFQDQKQAILENENGEQLKFDINVTNEKTLSFSFINTTPDIIDYKIGDNLNLAEHNNKYYIYTDES